MSFLRHPSMCLKRHLSVVKTQLLVAKNSVTTQWCNHPCRDVSLQQKSTSGPTNVYQSAGGFRPLCTRNWTDSVHFVPGIIERQVDLGCSRWSRLGDSLHQKSTSGITNLYQSAGGLRALCTRNQTDSVHFVPGMIERQVDLRRSRWSHFDDSLHQKATSGITDWYQSADGITNLYQFPIKRLQTCLHPISPICLHPISFRYACTRNRRVKSLNCTNMRTDSVHFVPRICQVTSGEMSWLAGY